MNLPDQMLQVDAPLLTAEPVVTTEAVTSPSNPFEVGDEVVVVKKVTSSTCTWLPEMDKCIGESGKVTQTCNDGTVKIGSLSQYWFHVSALAPAQYKPEAGDVVEFEYKGTEQNGVVYQSCCSSKGDLDVSYSGEDYGYHTGIKDVKNCRKIGHIEEATKVDCISSVRRLSKAYFSAFTPDPSLPYAERQAKWVKHHGIKVGSKVKVVRDWSNLENGCSTITGSDNNPHKALAVKDRAVGKIDSIAYEAFNVRMASKYDGNLQYPYFALEPVK